MRWDRKTTRGAGSPTEAREVCTQVKTRPRRRLIRLCERSPRVRLTNGMEVWPTSWRATIFKEHSVVLIRGGRVKGLPGVRYHIIRGVGRPGH